MTTADTLAGHGTVDGAPLLRPARRPLTQAECLERLRRSTSGRVAITAGALPHIAVVRYSLAGDTIFFDVGSDGVARRISQQIVAFETGTTDADPRGESWSVCVVGKAILARDERWEEPLLSLHTELINGWTSTPQNPPAPPHRRSHPGGGAPGPG